MRSPVNPFLEQSRVKKTFVVPTLREEANLTVMTLQPQCSPFAECIQ